jgi:hypothetical protein
MYVVPLLHQSGLGLRWPAFGNHPRGHLPVGQVPLSPLEESWVSYSTARIGLDFKGFTCEMCLCISDQYRYYNICILYFVSREATMG